ncbi:MAG: lysoplasmalogenase, partial [Chitinophagales bacterium]|nr:lysoplasmalogenase [Chitinophagales bacterium]
NFFFAGLGAFLITHVLYINCYIKMMGKNEGFLKRFPLYASPLLIYFVALMFLVFPKLQGVLRFPVAVYSITILLMVLCAMNLFSLVSKKIFFNIFSGALLFMISDSLIALDKFVSPIAFAGVFIMAFYVGGQYLIIKGFALHSKSA